ncbi:MAG: ABC transporter substrate binding protein [Pseudomonadota bacterium]
MEVVLRSMITRLVIGVAVLLLAAPLSGEAQQAGKGARLGYVEGKNLTTMYRYAEGKPERLAGLANELAALKPDVIFALGGDVAPFARTATNAIPIVMAVSVDPVQSGLVASLAKPGEKSR